MLEHFVSFFKLICLSIHSFVHLFMKFMNLFIHSSIHLLSPGMFLYALMDFDAVNGNIQIVGSLSMEWQDQIKTLTSTTFTASLQTIFVSHDQIWAPNLVLLNDAESIRAVGDTAYKVRYNVRYVCYNSLMRNMFSLPLMPWSHLWSLRTLP